MDREAWRAAIHGVRKSWTWLSDWNELNWSDAILFFTALDFTCITSHIPDWMLFLLWLCLFILSEVISPLFSGSLRKQTLGRHKQNLVCTRTQKKEQWYHKKLTQTYPWMLRVSSDLLQGWWHWVQRSFWRSSPLSSLPPPYLASGQTTGREHSPAHQQKVGLKIYWAWPCLPGQNLDFFSVSLSHPEASISMLSLSSRGWKWSPSVLSDSLWPHGL